MQTLNGTNSGASVVESEQSAPTGNNIEAGTPEAKLKNSGLHVVTPCTMKSLKTSFDQTSKHCIDFGSHWKAGRMARGSVNCLRIVREVTLVLPRAGVAFGNDLAEHTFSILDKIADHFDGKHEQAAAVPKETSGKRKPRWLAIFFMLFVLLYCFNALKSFNLGHVNVVVSENDDGKDKKEKTEKAQIAEKAVEAALAKELKDAVVDDESSSESKAATPAKPASAGSKAVSKSSVSETKIKKKVIEFVKDILESQ